jgi:hypothetical protein|tara:strand:+ start:1853 stop:2707 length:855 start_codon:yes stop_codon:yes gene_type:complete
MSKKIIFVADAFSKDFIGGAELSTDALISKTNKKIQTIRSHLLTDNFIKENKDNIWIFGNFSNVNNRLIYYFIKSNIDYHIIEYDFKYCSFRSPQKHEMNSGVCNCHKENVGKIISLFMNKANSLWFMSEKQKNVYTEKFNFLDKETTQVLSSIFLDSTIHKMLNMKNKKNNKYLIFDSNNWLKGTTAAINYAKNNNLSFELVKNLKYEKMLEKLSASKGLIFLPHAHDTCPRITIEAKLLDCDLILGENVLHKEEQWFKGTNEETVNHLLSNGEVFWRFLDER